MRVLFVGYRDVNHSSAGGYDRIIGCPNSNYILGEDLPFGFIPVGRRGKFLNLFFLNLYAKFYLSKYDIVHFFYGEMLRSYKRDKRCKIVATIHMRVDADKRPKQIEYLRKADGVITLSSHQAEELRLLYGINACFIPHGFHEPSFRYKQIITSIDKVNVIVSGKNYRDKDTLFKIIDFCEKHRKDIFFHLLGQTSDIKEALADKLNAYCYPRLCDDDYFSVISDADYNFLPLTYATANNALLEASFLGVRSILPRINGIMDYAAPEPLNMFYNNNDELIQIFNSLGKKDYDGKAVKNYAQRFLWSNVYKQLLSFYETL